MSISISEILKNQLYLGNLSAALTPPANLHITHILSICPDYPSTTANHLTIPIKDTEYDDLLIHLPKACAFIQNAVDAGGRVLVHCVMGVSRSVAVVIAYLMQSTLRTPLLCLQSVRKRRPQAHPNYGFLKQLEAFEECGYNPSSTHPSYRAWKRRQKREVGRFIGTLEDVVEVKMNEGELFFTSEFPTETYASSTLLITLGVTHLLTISPSSLATTLSSLCNGVQHQHVNIPNSDRAALLLSLPKVAGWIKDALTGGGVVLVHCLVESRGVAAVVASIMMVENKAPDEAFAIVDDALPLFNPTKSFHRTLSLFHSTHHAPTRSHPLVLDWLAEEGWDAWSSAGYDKSGFTGSSRRGSNESSGSSKDSGSGKNTPWGSEESTPWGSEYGSRATTPDLDEKLVDVDVVPVVPTLQRGFSAPVTTKYTFAPSKSSGIDEIMSPSLVAAKNGYFPKLNEECTLAEQMLEDSGVDLGGFGEALAKIGLRGEERGTVEKAVRGMQRWESAGPADVSTLKSALLNSAAVARDGREGRRQER